MTCKDCLYFKACADIGEYMTDEYIKWTSVNNDVRDLCYLFTDKADFVEVVRCKNCKHWRQSHKGIMTTVGYCHNDDFPFLCERTPCTREDDYCSFGERNANE